MLKTYGAARALWTIAVDLRRSSRAVPGGLRLPSRQRPAILQQLLFKFNLSKNLIF